MSVLDVDVERASTRVLESRNRLISRLDAVDRNTLQLRGVLFEEAVSEDPKRIGIGGKLLDDQIIVLAGLDESAVLANRGADGLMLVGIGLLERDHAGIGFATAKEFVSEGAYVFITGRRESELNAAVKEIGSNVTAVQGDVSKLDDLDRLFAQIKQEKGKLDIVFANAGIAKYAPLGQTGEELFDSIFDIKADFI